MSAAKGYEVCASDVDGGWRRFEDARTPQEAARKFLVAEDYDERDFDTGRPFNLQVRKDDDSDPVNVSVRVIPMHFEVT